MYQTIDIYMLHKRLLLAGSFYKWVFVNFIQYTSNNIEYYAAVSHERLLKIPDMNAVDLTNISFLYSYNFHHLI